MGFPGSSLHARWLVGWVSCIVVVCWPLLLCSVYLRVPLNACVMMSDPSCVRSGRSTRPTWWARIAGCATDGSPVFLLLPSLDRRVCVFVNRWISDGVVCLQGEPVVAWLAVYSVPCRFVELIGDVSFAVSTWSRRCVCLWERVLPWVEGGVPGVGNGLGGWWSNLTVSHLSKQFAFPAVERFV